MVYAAIVAGCSCEHSPPLKEVGKVEFKAAPSSLALASAQAVVEVPSDAGEPACVLSDREWRDVTLWPSIEGLEAYRRPRDPSPQVVLRMRGERGAFHVAHGTKCDLLESSALGARVRVLEGPKKGRTGWVLHDWHVGK
jgi:hypothetical protein